MHIILWILFGALVGWIASIITGRDESQGALGNIGVGILGAIIGGWLASMMGLGNVTGFNISSLLIATLGAVIILFGFNMITHHNNR